MTKRCPGGSNGLNLNDVLAVIHQTMSWRFADTDKALCILLVCDDLSSYATSEVFGSWENSRISEQLERRQRIVEEFLFSNSSGVTQILFLFLLSSPGRTVFAGLGKLAPPHYSPRLLMSDADFEVIVLLEAADGLGLLKYSLSSERLRNTTEVLSYSPLDEYVAFRDNHNSYYFSDSALPSAITFGAGDSGKLRFEILERFDFHGATHYMPRYVTEVASLFETRHIPIYVPLAELGTRPSMLVEGLPVLVWVIASPDNGPKDHSNVIDRAIPLLVDMAAYWIWQISSDLSHFLERIAESGHHVFVFELNFVSTTESPDSSLSGDFADVITFKLHESSRPLSITFTFIGEEQFASANNAGERNFVRQLLSAIASMLETIGALDTADKLRRETSKLLEKYAPLGIKKKLLILDSSRYPQLDQRSIPSFRRLQSWDQNVLLDELGNFLATEAKLPEGKIPSDKRVEVLNSVVAYFYSRLEALLSSMAGDVLLEYLVAQHEAIVYESAFRRLTMPTQLACFGNEPELIAQINKQIPELSEAGVACRFLIEYVAACPPRGSIAISLAAYDQALALAAEIIHWADESDRLRYGIIDIEYAVLRSGRLGAERKNLKSAYDAFLPLRSREEIDRAASFFARHWNSAPTEITRFRTAEAQEIDVAFEVEFGTKLSFIVELIAEAASVGLSQNETPLKKMECDEFVKILSVKLKASSEQVQTTVDLLSLTARDDFMVPPSPYRKQDVYPWRFTRPLSYMRKPLIRVTQFNRDYVCWGTRHLFASIEYIVGLCLGGRLQAQAKSKQMQQLISKFQRQNGREFVGQVAAVASGITGIIVDTNVKKINGVRIGLPERELGDIDVLIIAPQLSRVYAIECKDLEVGRTANEMAHELDELFRGTPKSVSVVMKHLRRCEWLRQHTKDVDQHYGVPMSNDWLFEPIMVVSEEMFSPHMYKSQFPVFTLRRFAEELPRLLGRRSKHAQRKPKKTN